MTFPSRTDISPTMMPVYPGDEEASEILKAVGSDLNLSRMRALLAGVLMGLEYVPPSAVLPEIDPTQWNKPTFQNKEKAEKYLSVFFGLWNEMAAHREPDRPFVPSKPDSEWKNEDIESWLNFAELLENELGDFLVGLELSQTPALAELQEDGVEVEVEEYLPFIAATRMNDLGKERKKLKRIKNKNPELLLKIIEGTLSDFQKNHRAFINLMRSIEVVDPKTQKMPSKREVPKIGRNEPCPCGSGKKFKQCCLQ